MPSAKPLIDTPNETLREVQTKTHLRDTLVEVETRKVVNIWVVTVVRVEIRTVIRTHWGNWRTKN